LGQLAASNGDADVGGLKLDLEDHPSGGVVSSIARQVEGVYRLQELPFEDGNVVLDIGAHVGVVSIYLAKEHPGITVHAFEPLPENYKRLVRNITANGVSNVVAHNEAVSEDGRDLVLVTDVKSNSGGASAFVVGPDAGESVTVPSVTLTEVFETYVADRCRLLKIDCEGAEYEILKDAPLERIDYIRGEFHTNEELTRRGADPAALTERLGEALPGDGRVLVSTIRMAQ
jgi:FkbM family methyltransferase